MNRTDYPINGICFATYSDQDMWFTLAVVCLVIYLACSAWFLIGSIAQLHLVWHAKKYKNVETALDTARYPTVTVQVPVYNERYVITRLLAALDNLDYPSDKLDIQVLDDSTDDTSTLIDETATKMNKMCRSVTVIRRENRDGFKAGALQRGLPLCKGELIAIFDADFIPPSNFLKRMVGYFDDDSVGGVQGRWAHHNLRENALTRIQAFLLDSHFQLEQQGRNAAGYFLNFNGTAGIWRKQCIVECGGWNGDVLTEDLELSYRAQLKGWKFRYANDITVPAELPSDIEAFKSQQFRWAKGMAQTASKHLAVVCESNVDLLKKFHAFTHLLGSLSFVAVLGNIIMVVPILAARQLIPEFAGLSNLILLTGITLPLVSVYYFFGTSSTLSRQTFWKYLPLFLMIYMALSVQNTIAVLEGLAGKSSPFIRTPKSRDTALKLNQYIVRTWKRTNSAELFFILYLLAAVVLSIAWGDYFLLLFVAMALTGLLYLISGQFHSLWQKTANVVSLRNYVREGVR
jgi:cellulose synthase/poly-beta-1,6-N-acetylglucosamine synthase-like glycosyltransferase